MSRYIDADKLLDRIHNPYEMAAVARWVNEAPTADVRENVRGKWKKREEAWRNGIRIRIRRCSNCCGAKPLQVFDAEDEEFSYCPWCGAKMENEE